MKTDVVNIKINGITSSDVLFLISSDMMYGSRYTLDDVVESMKKTGVGLKGNTICLNAPAQCFSLDKNNHYLLN